MQDTKSNQEIPETLSPEEIKQRKSEMMSFWNEQKDFLQAQAAHEELVTRIDELRTRSWMARVQLANLMAPPEAEQSQPSKPPAKERSLKQQPVKPIIDTSTTTIA